MALCFWRHSHPDYQTDGQDPQLSEWGHKEALRAAIEIKNRVGDRSLKIFSSPMKRCLETAEALCQVSETLLEERASLRLKDSWESESDFKIRLDSSLAEFKKNKGSEVFVLCTHSDVLDHYLHVFGGPRFEIEKANFFWVVDGRVKEVNPL